MTPTEQENNKRSKLTNTMVQGIRQKFLLGKTHVNLSLEYGVSRISITQCINGTFHKPKTKEEIELLHKCKEKTSVKYHGGTNTKLYHVWNSMKQRCTNPKSKPYKNYGGRGIYISEEWSVFSLFAEWAKNNGYREGLEIDRINNDGPYSSNNCRFTTKDINVQNSRSAKLNKSKVTFIRCLVNKGLTRKEVAILYGLKKSTLDHIIAKRNWRNI